MIEDLDIGSKNRRGLDQEIFHLIWRYGISTDELAEVLREGFPPGFRATKTNIGLNNC